jgi:hypothetical protein
VADVVAVVADLMLASRVQEALRAAGHDVRIAPSVAAVESEDSGPAVVVADLNEVDPAELLGLGCPVLGFYSHVDVDTRRRAERQGVDLVVPRSRLVREMPQLVDSLLDSTS